MNQSPFPLAGIHGHRLTLSLTLIDTDSQRRYGPDIVIDIDCEHRYGPVSHDLLPLARRILESIRTRYGNGGEGGPAGGGYAEVFGITQQTL